MVGAFSKKGKFFEDLLSAISPRVIQDIMAACRDVGETKLVLRE